MKTKTLFKSIFGMAFIGLLLLMASCDAAGNPSSLVGRWVGVSGSDKGAVMELLSDGTGVIFRNTKGRDGVAVIWKTEKDRCYFTVSGKASAFNYKLQGSLLTFTDDDGEINEYAKCNKDCETAAKEYAEAEAKKAATALKAKFAAVKKSSFTDSRDGKSYKTLKLDNQTWMAENLNYNADGSKCYENQESNCQKYGRLYDWKTSLSACPKGWHLPSNDEWQILVDLADGDKVAGSKLKASSGWNQNGNGTDAAGFSALPGGNGYSDGNFSYVGNYGYWWASSEYDSSNAYIRRMNYDGELVYYNGSGKSYLFSVRCVQD